jgi:hypothetical protein
MAILALGVAFGCSAAVGTYFLMARAERCSYVSSIRASATFQRLQRNDLACAIGAFIISAALAALLIIRVGY